MKTSKTTTLAPWFGSNRTLAPHVGSELAGCRWVGVPFAGGMSEVAHITATTVLVNDLHRHIINLARVVADDNLRPRLVARLRDLPFHPDTLESAQRSCRQREEGEYTGKDCPLWWACDYFVACWMGRSSKAGTSSEFEGSIAIRWTASGGDSAVRYHSAIRSLVEWGKTFRRCTFTCEDAFDFLTACKDHPEHGIYCDPPFPEVGRGYLHNPGKTSAAEMYWHMRLAHHVERFTRTRVVMRFYDHPMIRQLYPESRWTWKPLEGRTQANKAAAEVLLTNHRETP